MLFNFILIILDYMIVSFNIVYLSASASDCASVFFFSLFVTFYKYICKFYLDVISILTEVLMINVYKCWDICPLIDKVACEVHQISLICQLVVRYESILDYISRS